MLNIQDVRMRKILCEDILEIKNGKNNQIKFRNIMKNKFSGEGNFKFMKAEYPCQIAMRKILCLFIFVLLISILLISMVSAAEIKEEKWYCQKSEFFECTYGICGTPCPGSSAWSQAKTLCENAKTSCEEETRHCQTIPEINCNFQSAFIYQQCGGYACNYKKIYNSESEAKKECKNPIKMDIACEDCSDLRECQRCKNNRAIPKPEGERIDECYVCDGNGNKIIDIDNFDKCIKVNLALNPEYIKKTKKERKFTPTNDKITGFDDIVCEARVSTSEDLSLQARLITRDKKTNQDVIISSGFLVYSRDEGDVRIYNWKIKGWPYGWAGDEIMEKIIENENVRCEVDLGGEKIKSEEIETSNCVRLWGDEKQAVLPFSIVNMRGKSTKLSPYEIVRFGEITYKNGFHAIDPFKSYKEKFAYYADLVEHDDEVYSVYSGFYDPENKKFFGDWQFRQVPKDSACENARLYVFHNSRTYSAYSKKYAKIIFVNYLSALSAGYDKIGNIILHETGHAFCGLDDEYMLFGSKKFPKDNLLRKNCAQIPYWKNYGERNLVGCFVYKNFYKPSQYSIMHTFPSPYDNKFNVVSCGYCLKEIKEDLSPIILNFQKCMNYDTVKPIS